MARYGWGVDRGAASISVGERRGRSAGDPIARERQDSEEPAAAVRPPHVHDARAGRESVPCDGRRRGCRWGSARRLRHLSQLRGAAADVHRAVQHDAARRSADEDLAGRRLLAEAGRAVRRDAGQLVPRVGVGRRLRSARRDHARVARRTRARLRLLELGEVGGVALAVLPGRRHPGRRAAVRARREGRAGTEAARGRTPARGARRRGGGVPGRLPRRRPGGHHDDRRPRVGLAVRPDQPPHVRSRHVADQLDEPPARRVRRPPAPARDRRRDGSARPRDQCRRCLLDVPGLRQGGQAVVPVACVGHRPQAGGAGLGPRRLPHLADRAVRSRRRSRCQGGARPRRPSRAHDDSDDSDDSDAATRVAPSAGRT